MRDDIHGKLVKGREIKLYRGGSHSWKMKLSQIDRMKGSIYILTYSLPDVAYGLEVFRKRDTGIKLICNSKFENKAKQYKEAMPKIEIGILPYMHSKILIIEPETIFMGSENFGNSTWHETEIGIKSKKLAYWYIENDFKVCWNKARKIYL